MIITGFNPPLDDLEVTYLLSPESAGTTAHSVKNNLNFANNDRVLIGQQGQERSEIVSVTSVSGTNTITTTATSFDHDADDPITRLRYDQVKFYRSVTTSTGAYTNVATVALDVNQEGLITTYDDTSGIATYYYQVSYYNSVSTLESAKSDPVLGGGYLRDSVGFIIDEIIREVKDPNLDRTELLGLFNECSDDLQSRSKRPYRFLSARTTLSRVAGASTINFPTDTTTGNQLMWKFERLDYNFVDSTTNPATNIIYPVRIISLPEFRQNYQNQTASSSTESDQVRVAALDETRSLFRIYPTPLTSSAGIYYLYYWKYFTELNSEGDLFETPNPRVYKLYAMFRYYLQKAASDLGFMQIANQFQALYEKETIKLKKFDNRDAGSPFQFKFLPQTYKGNREF